MGQQYMTNVCWHARRTPRSDRCGAAGPDDRPTTVGCRTPRSDKQSPSVSEMVPANQRLLLGPYQRAQ